MNFGLLAEAPLTIKMHVATVLPAFALGTWQIFFSTKGARYHRVIGLVYLALMAATAIIAWFIRENGHLSWLHLLVPLTLFGVVSALWAVRHGNIPGHRNAMISLYVGALLIAGSLAFLPGRLLHRMFFG